MPEHLQGIPFFDEEEEEIKDLELEEEQESSEDGEDWDDDGGFEAEEDLEESEDEDDSAATEEESDEDTSEDEDDDQNEESDESEDTEDESVEEVQESQDSEENTATQEEEPKKGEPDPELAREAYKRREAERRLREAEQQKEAENLQRYLDEARDDEAELLRRQAQVQNYVLDRERSQVLQDKLDVGINRAVAELGIQNMDDATKQYLARRLDEFEQGRVVKDQYGNIREVRGDVYQYIKEEMDSISQFRSVGAREQAKKKQTEKARTVKTPTRTPKEKPTDPDLDAFDEEANRW